MALLPYTVTALSRTDIAAPLAGDPAINIVAGAIVRVFDLLGVQQTIYDDDAGTNGQLQKVTNSDGQTTFFIGPGSYVADVNGNQFSISIANASKVKTAVQPVNSIADLRGLEADFEGQQISLSGYYSDSLEGGGIFVWDAASTAADDGGVTFAVAGVTTGRWIRQFNGKVDVTWFGINPSRTAAQNSDAIESLIAAHNLIFFPNIGVYQFDREIIISRDEVGLFGDRRGGGSRLQFPLGSGIIWQPTDLQNGSRVRGGYLRDIFINGSSGVGAPSGYGLSAIMCGNFRCENVAIQNFSGGVLVQGGQSVNFSNLRVFGQVSNLISDPSGRYLFHVRPHQRDSLPTIPTYVVGLNDFEFGGGPGVYNVEDVIRVEGVDGLNIDNGYINGSRSALMHLTSVENSSAGAIVGFNCQNVYFDGTLGSGGSDYGLKFSREANASGGVVNGFLLSNCKLANYKESAIFSNLGCVIDASINHCHIKNSQGLLVDITGASNEMIKISESTLKDGLGLSVNGLGTLKFTDNTVTGHTVNAALSLYGVINNIIFDSNEFRGNASGDLSNQLTGFTSIAIGENTGDMSGLLDRGLFTPLVFAGGALSDFTISGAAGRFTTYKNIVNFTMGFTLDAKGSSTGALEIRMPNVTSTGLAIPKSTQVVNPVALRINNFGNSEEAITARTIGTGLANPLAVRIERRNNFGQLTAVTAESLPIGCVINISGSYFIN